MRNGIGMIFCFAYILIFISHVVLPCTSLACRFLTSSECLRNRSGWTCSRKARLRRGTYADVPTDDALVVFIDPKVLCIVVVDFHLVVVVVFCRCIVVVCFSLR